MTYQPLLISNYETGLERDLEPWLLPNDGFPDLYDCYCWRGRIIRKLNDKQVGRLQRWQVAAGTIIGVHDAQPKVIGPIVFPSLPVSPGSVSITDGTVIYYDDGIGNLISSTPGYAITGISNAAAAVITFAALPALLNINDVIWISGAKNAAGTLLPINGLPLTISNVGALNITVVYDSSADPAWVSGGAVGWYGGSINYATGTYTVTYWGAITGTNVVAKGMYFPNEPVMGLTEEDTTSINQEALIAFDMHNAYRFNNVVQQFEDISFATSIAAQTGAITWNSTNSDFFWSVNYANAVFTCNFVSGDPIRYLATPSGGAECWRDFQPWTDKAAKYPLLRCRMIFPYRGHLVVINTVEKLAAGTLSFPQRARWSQQGTPYYLTGGQDTPPAPFGYNVDAWADNVGGKGGYADAATREEALSAGFIDDNLVVFFERSTWLLRYTNDPNNAFVWERVNMDLGSESTFSTITFDKGMFTVGNTGIITCDGNNVTRIDQKIPDEVFKFQNQNQGAKRVHGIRNFKRQLAYWTIPNDVGGEIYPNRVLMVNYIEASYAYFKSSYTCFGTYQPAYDLRWNSLEMNTPWENWNFTWSNPVGQSFDPEIVAGNQQGFVMMIDQKMIPEPSLFIQSITSVVHPVFTSPNHNLQSGQFISIVNLSGTGNLAQFENRIFKVSVPIVNASTFTLSYMTSTGPQNTFDPVFTYVSLGEIIVYNNFEVKTKRFNLGLNDGRQTSLGYTDFYVDLDKDGEFQCDVFIDEDTSRPIISNTVSLSAEPTTSFTLKKTWKRSYTRMVGQLYQYRLYLNDSQMYNQINHITDFALHGMMMWVGKAGRMPYG